MKQYVAEDYGRVRQDSFQLVRFIPDNLGV